MCRDWERIKEVKPSPGPEVASRLLGEAAMQRRPCAERVT